jgi:hypothetical protein
MIELQKVRQALLQNEIFIFSSDYGKKGVTDTKAQRLKNQVTAIDQFKDHSNYNIFTGYSNICDVDLDCKEVRLLADQFLSPTGVMFGRESAPRSHRLYKIIDLDKKHSRVFHQFRDSATDNCLIELRAHNHYTMCMGKYDNGEKVQYTGITKPAEINWDQLHKDYSMLALAAVILRKYPGDGLRNDYIKLMVAALWQYKVYQEDCTKIINAVASAANDEEINTRLARIKDIYKKDPSDRIQGLPKLVEQFSWTKNEYEDFKKMLYAITGRHTLPAATHELITKIAYMMKQKKFYDLEDKEKYDAEAIDMKYAKDFNGKYTPLKFWKMHKDRKVCVDFTYKPAKEPERFVYVEKKLMVNVFEKHDLQPDSKVDTDIYHELLAHVIPHDVCRDHFLDWNACILQNPATKIRHALIMQSDTFQLGKGSLFDVMRDILGRVNAKKIELSQALDKGKGYLINSQLVLIDEAKSKGTWSEKAQLINTLKTIVSEGSQGVRQLYREYEEQDTCSNYWINTNHRDAFALPANEVRYWVYFSEAKRNEAMLEEYHNARLKHNLAAGVFAELLERDISKFKPNGIAPHTIYRDMMTTLADKPLNDYVKERFEQGVNPFDRDLVTTTELFDWLRAVGKIKVTRENDVALALAAIGGTRKRGCPVHKIGKNVNIWIIRNHDKYKNLTATGLGEIYTPFFEESKK